MGTEVYIPVLPKIIPVSVHSGSRKTTEVSSEATPVSSIAPATKKLRNQSVSLNQKKYPHKTTEEESSEFN
jgi:hypothetical protein